jgi:hypothetical protein
VAALGAIDGSPWAEWRSGKTITVHQVAAMLDPFGIHPKTVRFGNKTAKGYMASDFEDAFGRYVSRA